NYCNYSDIHSFPTRRSSDLDDTELTEEMIEKNEMINQEVLSQMGETEEVREVVVGTSGQTKPLNYFDDDNNLVGLEIDILEEMKDRKSTRLNSSHVSISYAV